MTSGDSFAMENGHVIPNMILKGSAAYQGLNYNFSANGETLSASLAKVKGAPSLFAINFNGLETPTIAPGSSTATMLEMGTGIKQDYSTPVTLAVGTDGKLQILAKEGYYSSVDVTGLSKGGGGKELNFFIAQAEDVGVRFLVCQPSLDLHGYTMDDMREGVEMIGGAAFNDMACDADAVIAF